MHAFVYVINMCFFINGACVTTIGMLFLLCLLLVLPCLLVALLLLFIVSIEYIIYAYMCLCTCTMPKLPSPLHLKTI